MGAPGPRFRRCRAARRYRAATYSTTVCRDGLPRTTKAIWECRSNQALRGMRGRGSQRPRRRTSRRSLGDLKAGRKAATPGILQGTAVAARRGSAYAPARPTAEAGRWHSNNPPASVQAPATVVSLARRRICPGACGKRPFWVPNVNGARRRRPHGNQPRCVSSCQPSGHDACGSRQPVPPGRGRARQETQVLEFR